MKDFTIIRDGKEIELTMGEVLKIFYKRKEQYDIEDLKEAIIVMLDFEEISKETHDFVIENINEILPIYENNLENTSDWRMQAQYAIEEFIKEEKGSLR